MSVSGMTFSAKQRYLLKGDSISEMTKGESKRKPKKKKKKKKKKPQY